MLGSNVFRKRSPMTAAAPEHGKHGKMDIRGGRTLYDFDVEKFWLQIYWRRRTLALSLTVSEIRPFIAWNFPLKIAAKRCIWRHGYYWQPIASSSWRETFSRSIPPLRFVAKTSDLLPAVERRSLLFPCSGRPDGSKWWEVDHEHVSNQEMAGHRLGLRSKSEGSGLLERPLWVWQHDQTVRVFASIPDTTILHI